jgi:hypothetical protein
MRFPPRCYYCRRVVRWPFGLTVFRGSVRRCMLHTVLAWSLPNGHADKQMLFLLIMASQTIASNFPATQPRAEGFGQGRQRHYFCSAMHCRNRSFSSCAGETRNTHRRGEAFAQPSHAFGNAACQHSGIEVADTDVVHLETRRRGEASCLPYRGFMSAI